MTVRVIGTRFGVTAREMRPTLKHRLAISRGIFGTVYGANAAGEARYFDFDYQAAAAFAGVKQELDPRWSRPSGRYAYVKSGCLEANPRPGEWCLWVTR
jgi:hypothetical protein